MGGSAPDLTALTAREREIARAAASGAAVSALAAQLVVSPRTVETHLSRIYRKLGVGSRSELVALLLRAADERVAAPSPAAAPPAGPTHPGAFPFTGRRSELTTLHGAWNDVGGGACQLVLVCGEPGIGKTRLAEELAGIVRLDGGVVLTGRCDEFVRTPYQPFAEALRWSVRHLGADRLGPRGAELARLAPEIVDAAGALPAPLAASPDAQRLVLFDAVHEWLANLAQGRGALLVLDDLHWADRDTLLLLRHLMAVDPLPSLLVVGAYRDTDVGPEHALRQVTGELRRRAAVDDITLHGLPIDEVAAFLARSVAFPTTDDAGQLAPALHRLCGGNPFFLGELVRHLSDRAGRDGAEGLAAGLAGTTLPASVRRIVEDRLDQLPEQTQEALRAAALAGHQFDLDLVALATGHRPSAVLDALEPALRAHLLIEAGAGRFDFSHALVRLALVEQLSATRRAHLHAALATALEATHQGELEAVAADLAQHWSFAGPTHRGQAARFAQQAAARATEQLAPEEAASWYARARELLDGSDPHLDAQLLFGLGSAQALTGAADWQDTLLQAARAARAVGDVPLMVDALCVHRRSSWEVSLQRQPPCAARIALLEAALEVEVLDARQRARLTAALAIEVNFTGDLDRRDELAAAARRLAGDVSDVQERLLLQEMLMPIEPRRLRTRAYQDARRQEARSAVQWARANDSQTLELHALLDLFVNALTTAEGDRHDLLRQIEVVLERYPHPGWADQLLVWRITNLLMDGEMEAATALVAEGKRRWIAHGMGEGQMYVSSARTQLAWERDGRAASAGPLAEAARRDDRAVSQALAAVALADAGRAAEAIAVLDRVCPPTGWRLPDDAALPVTRSLLAEAAARSGHLRACRELYELLLPYVGTFQATFNWFLGATERYLGLLAAALDDTAASDGWFASADEAHRRIASPTWRARSLLDWAETKLTHGDAPGAAELAQEALHVIGSRSLADSRARAERITCAS